VNRQDIIFQANAAYFNLLKAQKLAVIARQTVNQITAQRDVAKSYLMAGMTPLNSFLQAQVELANAKQESVIAANNIETAITDFNTLLRRPVDIKVELEDITAYKPIEHKLTFFQETAEKNRLEIEIADMNVQKAEKDMALSKKDYYPSIDLLGEYFKSGIEWDVAGGEGIFDPEGWSISAMASWNFWEWGKTRYGVKEKLSRLKQARHQRAEILDQIHRQVKQAYLKNLENEINIVTIKTAIDQAKENLRMSQERFKGQAATSTDVLIAQTLFTRTMTNYYTALYDFNISKAALYRAVGQKSTSQSTPL
jgi:outer membrane protein